jgi:polyprenyldihydroxybenzoate methyltransferase/3-demethylubiquinol 3-O-methyltransferase
VQQTNAPIQRHSDLLPRTHPLQPSTIATCPPPTYQYTHLIDSHDFIYRFNIKSKPKPASYVAKMPPTRAFNLPLRAVYRSTFSSSAQIRHHNTAASPNPSSSTVDPTEIHHFNALASSWWDPHGPSRLLHLMNPSRHDFLSSCLRSSSSISPIISSSGGKPGRGLDVLDVGCGGGIFAESAARLPWVKSVTGIDPSAKVLEVAREHMKADPTLNLSPSASPSTRSSPSLQYLQTDIDSLPQTPGYLSQGYDLVTLFEVVEHVSSPSSFLRSVMSKVKPGGWIVGSTIARTWTSWLVTKVVAEDVMRIVPRGTHDWNRYINEEEMRAWFAKQGEEWGEFRSVGVMYLPGVGWTEMKGLEGVGNYYFGVRRLPKKSEL